MAISAILGLMDNDMLRLMVYGAVPFVLSLTIHELAHARTALAFGDPTARDMGRVSLNPLRHLDPVGTVAIFLVGFGWAKPVPVNPDNLHPRRLGDIAVSLAGPASNLGLAILFCLLFKILHHFAGSLPANIAMSLGEVLLIGIVVNVGLFVFNLIPFYPLDGHHIVRELLPWRLQEPFMAWQRQFGNIAVMLLVFGPRLLGRASGNTYVDPIGLLYGNALSVFAAVGLL